MQSPEALLQLVDETVDDEKESTNEEKTIVANDINSTNNNNKEEPIMEKNNDKHKRKIKQLEDNIETLKNDNQLMRQQISNIHNNMIQTQKEKKNNKSLKEFFIDNKKILAIISVLVIIAIIATIIVNKTSLFSTKPKIEKSDESFINEENGV